MNELFDFRSAFFFQSDAPTFVCQLDRFGIFDLTVLRRLVFGPCIGFLTIYHCETEIIWESYFSRYEQDKQTTIGLRYCRLDIFKVLTTRGPENRGKPQIITENHSFRLKFMVLIFAVYKFIKNQISANS
jgi:hypothetical protein